jgi:hypothetical protein
MRLQYYFLIPIILLLFSCKKDKEITKDEPVVPTQAKTQNYAKLAVGNYWIYQRFRIDTTGVVTPLNIFDSCYVSSQTTLNGNTYYEMYRPNSYGTPYSHWRDSAGWVTNSDLRTLFSPTDFAMIFHVGYSTASSTDTIAKAINKMTGQDSLVNTPSGAFVTSNSQWTHYIYPNWKHFGGAIRRTNTCYAENIGIVLETLYIVYTDQYTYERRLVRYHVN